MPRRIGAAIAIVVILGLALTLVWRVYLHHAERRNPEAGAVVSLDAPRF